MKKLITGILLILLVGIAAGCSQSQPEEAIIMSTGADQYRSTTTATQNAPATAYAPSPDDGETASPEFDYGDADRMIVRTGDIIMVVDDIPGTMDNIVQIAVQYQGYVVSSRSWRSDEKLYGNISIRIPSDDYDAAVAAVTGLAVEITSQNSTSQDVTEEYTDLAAKLTNLEATEAQLLEIMQQAATVDEVLAVQRELSNTREDIERTKGRMQYLERTSATSLININLEQAKMTLKLYANTIVAQAGETIYFYPELTGGFSPYSYEWDYGDGTTGNSETGVHTYKTAGTYTVSLKITDDRDNSDTAIRQDYITINPGWSAGNTAGTAWHGLVIFGRVLLNILIWVGIFSPVWIIGGGIFLYIRYRRRKKTGS
jgi:PKD repeat protein